MEKNIFTKLLLMSTVTFISCSTFSRKTASLNPPENNWQLVWSDEFLLPIVNNWAYDIGGGGWGNNELQFYTSRKENSQIQQGHLVIESKKESFENQDYTSARLVSKEKWKYGRFEIRAKLPIGRGSWPAIWMLPDRLLTKSAAWPECGEIDIMEQVGFDPGVIHFSVHTKLYNWMNHTEKTNAQTIQKTSEEFHTYALEWFPDHLDFFVDNIPTFSFHKEKESVDVWPFDQAFHILLNNAIGGSWGGEQGIDDTSFPQKMEIEFVRVYQQKTKAL